MIHTAHHTKNSLASHKGNFLQKTLPLKKIIAQNYFIHNTPNQSVLQKEHSKTSIFLITLIHKGDKCLQAACKADCSWPVPYGAIRDSNIDRAGITLPSYHSTGAVP